MENLVFPCMGDFVWSVDHLSPNLEFSIILRVNIEGEGKIFYEGKDFASIRS